MLGAAALLMAASLLACAPPVASEPQPEHGPLRVAVTFYPNEYFVQRIGAEAVEVFCDVPAGADALFWIPNDEQLARMLAADLIVLQGAGLERWVGRASLPMSRVLVATKGMQQQLLQFEAGSAHSHGNGEQHDAGGIDPHVWLDPENAKLQAAAIHRRLSELLPEQAADFATRFAVLASELDELSAQFRAIAARGEPLCASHPAYAYLVSRFGFQIESFDFDPEKMPTEEQLSSLAASIGKSGASKILWEAEPTPEIARRLSSQLGLESLVFSPCELMGVGLRAKGESYLTIQRGNAARLR